MTINEQFLPEWFKKSSMLILPFMILLLIGGGILTFYGISKQGSATNLEPGTYDESSIIVKFDSSAFKDGAEPSTDTIEFTSSVPARTSSISRFFTSIKDSFIDLSTNNTPFNDSIYRLLNDNTESIEPVFNRQGAIHANNLAEFTLLGMDYVFKIELKEGKTVEGILAILKDSIDFEYAEPNYFPNYALVPNDPEYLQQKTELDLLEAEKAWDIHPGSTNNPIDQIVAAVIDTGIDLDHEDLADNIWINEDEVPNNGIDDDENGFIDDRMGWDFWGNDNDPNPNPGSPSPYFEHGTLVSGVVSAVTNNSKGVASTAWNSAKIMSLRVANLGFEAIQYAVDNEADIINMSYGVPFYLETVETAINYARENSVISVASAGNNMPEAGYEWETPMFPAAFNGVIAVGGIDINLERHKDSNYGSWVDTMAPYTFVTTMNDDVYFGASGTSMSAPLVSGLAALIKSKYPNWSAQRVAGRIRGYADNIFVYQPWEPCLIYKIGLGKINNYKSIQINDLNKYPTGTLVARKSYPDSIYYIDGLEGYFIRNDIFIRRKFKNNAAILLEDQEFEKVTGAANSNLRFPDGTLLKEKEGDTIYIIEYNFKRPFESLAVFNSLGYNIENVIEIGSVFLDKWYSTGDSITPGSKYISGTLLGNDTPGHYDEVYLVDNNGKRRISKNILSYQYHLADIIYVDSTVLDDYPTLSSVKYRDGAILKCSGDECEDPDHYTIYIVEFGDKRPMLFGIFSRYGYNSENIIEVSKSELDKYQTGPPLGIQSADIIEY